MNAYIWMMIAVLLLAFLLRGGKKENTVFILAAVLVMFCILGLRDSTKIGNDSRTSYYWQFLGVAKTSWSGLLPITAFKDNPGLVYFMKLVSAAGGDYFTFTMVYSAVVLLSFAYLVQRYSVSPVQSICYYWGLILFLLMFDAMKQAVAMSVLLFAFDAIIKKRPILFLVLVLFAAWFHYPALAFLPAYWIARMKVERSYLIMLVGLLVVTFLFRDRILNFMLDAYQGEGEEVSLDGVKFMGNKVIIMLVIIVAALVLRPLRSQDYVYCTLIKFAGIATVFQTFCYYNNIFERLADYYFQFAVVLIPLVFDAEQQTSRFFQQDTERQIKTFAPYLFCAFSVWRFSNYIANDWHYLPFKFFFQ